MFSDNVFCLHELHRMSGLYWSCELSGLPGTQQPCVTRTGKIDHAFRDKTGTQINNLR